MSWYEQSHMGSLHTENCRLEGESESKSSFADTRGREDKAKPFIPKKNSQYSEMWPPKNDDRHWNTTNKSFHSPPVCVLSYYYTFFNFFYWFNF